MRESRERILVADDEDLVRSVVQKVLTYDGYEVEEARDGQDALEKYLGAGTEFDLVLMDLQMPNLTGREALLRMREKEPGLRAILLSGGMEESDSGVAQGLEGVEYLLKPFDNQQLLRKVREVLDAGR